MSKIYDIRHWFSRQILQQRNWHHGAGRREIINDLLLGLAKETGEIQQRLHNGPHQLRARPIDLPTVAHDAIDIIKYVLAIAATAGVTPDQLAETFWAVTDAVDDRWRREQADLKGERVLVVDIDGCLADFDTGFKEWLDGRVVEGPELEDVKQAFYASGGFARLDPLPGAATAMHEAKRMGMKIAIITARPKRRHANVETDTVGWLRRWEIPYDLLVFDRDKAEAICEHVLPATVVAAIEDRTKHAVEIAALDIPVVLFNDEELADPRITSVDNWDAARGEFTALFDALTDEGEDE